MLYFSIENARGGREKYNLGCEAGCGLTVSFSDRPRIVSNVSSFFSTFL